MKQYLDLLQNILDNGTEKKDRTGIGTISLFGVQLKFDLSEGFPLITTKKMFTKGLIHETLWFLKGDTNVKYLQDNNVRYWDSWADENNELGPIYGKQFRNIETIDIKSNTDYDDNSIQDRDSYIKQFDKTINLDFTYNTCGYVGKEFESNKFGKFTVIKEIPPKESGKNKSQFIVKFYNTGFETEVTSKELSTLYIRDLYQISVFGVGIYGNYNKHDKYLKTQLTIWRDILRRCYYKKCERYQAYGAKGVHVDPKWLCFENFQNDFRKIHNWELKIEYPKEYSIDKDILFNTNRYSLKTCMFATREEQYLNTSKNIWVSAIDPDGKEVIEKSINSLCNKYGLKIGEVFRCLNGEQITHYKWTNFKYLNKNFKISYRKVDQLKTLIAQIKHNPDSRRLIIGLWNPVDLPYQQLPCCHSNHLQFNVTNGKLSCSMLQRSADMFLGNPVNIAYTALLTHMIAQVCNLNVGSITLNINDAHIYLNHIEQVKLQLTREPKPLPKLILNSDIKNIDDFKYEDIKIEGYECWPVIKGEVAV